MDDEVRRILNRKQDKILLDKALPTKNSMHDGERRLAFYKGKLYEFVKTRNQVFVSRYFKSTKNITDLIDKIEEFDEGHFY